MKSLVVGHTDGRPVTDLADVFVPWGVFRRSEDLFVCNARMADRVCRQGTHTKKCQEKR
jgi:hypothetical protein